jgi:hypothetical protein
MIVYPVPTRMETVFANDSIFRFDILIEGKDCMPLEVFMRVQRGESWDKPSARVIPGDYTE